MTVNLHPRWEDRCYAFLEWLRPKCFWLYWKLAYHVELYKSGIYGWRFEWLDGKVNR
jgi:hypothetical protein